MSNIYKGTLGLIGNTPLVEVVNIEKDQELSATVLAKLEYFNPAGSVKDHSGTVCKPGKPGSTQSNHRSGNLERHRRQGGFLRSRCWYRRNTDRCR